MTEIVAMTDSQDTPKRSVGSWLRIAAVGRNPKRTLIRALVLVAVCLVVFRFILLPIRVTGVSMEPTYHDHSVNLINRLAYLRHEPERGDVVGIRLTPGGDGSSTPKVMYLKRVVALPGETISFKRGRIFIDGNPLDEAYENGQCKWNTLPVTLGATEYFVVGDNRSMSQRDHVFGKVARSRIVGRVVL
jgi:signal peptidase I